MGTFEKILFTVGAVGAAATLLLPASGSLVLLRELVGVIPVLSFGIWFLKVTGMVCKHADRKNIFLIAGMAVLLLVYSGVKIGQTAVDLAQGSRTMVLYHCDVETGIGTKGIFSLSYKLKGEDSAGKRYRLQISGSDLQALEGRDTVTVEYYVNTGGVVGYR